MDTNATSRRQALALSGAALAGALAGCLAPTDRSAPAQADDATDDASVYTRVYRETVGSVVLVQTDDGQGSGFVVDGQHLLTNYHVVAGAQSVQVRFREGEWRPGRAVGSDAYSDLAVVSVPDRPEYARPLAFQTDPTVGQEVVVLGNPFGLDGTLTTGVVSGVNRAIPSPAGYTIPDAVQTDAAVNPGNSGGPIVSLAGDVLAVVNSGGGDNVAFGISAALARRVVPALIESGTYDHPYLGASFVDVTPAIAAANGLDPAQGIVVVEVVEGGPADGALRPSQGSAVVGGRQLPVGGDVVVAIDDERVKTLEDLSSHLALQTRPGDATTLTVLRDGEPRSVEVRLGTRPRPG
ncbi:MAG: S1C family serine protease [Haloarculaceae archaeon]